MDPIVINMIMRRGYQSLESSLESSRQPKTPVMSKQMNLFDYIVKLFTVK